jgi:hypothetical protein
MVTAMFAIQRSVTARGRWMLEIVVLLTLLLFVSAPSAAEKPACPLAIFQICSEAEAQISYESYSYCNFGMCGIDPTYDDFCSVDCTVYSWQGEECSLGENYSCRICSEPSCTENGCCLG